MGNHFYHIRRAPLSVTIFITHVRILRNGSYSNEKYSDCFEGEDMLKLKRAYVIL